MLGMYPEETKHRAIVRGSSNAPPYPLPNFFIKKLKTCKCMLQYIKEYIREMVAKRWCKSTKKEEAVFNKGFRRVYQKQVT